MSEKNPRYPHWCRIIRKTTDDPLEDEDDFTVAEDDFGRSENRDYDFDPMGSDEDEEPSDDGQQQETPAEETQTQEDTVEGSQTEVIYEGPCRSYKINTTSDKGEVITSQRGLALPLNQDGWDALGRVPKEGDEIVVAHGTTHKEYGRVIDKNVATAEFAGTHLTWKYGRN